MNTRGRRSDASADGWLASGTCPQTRQIEGSYTILELPNREAAVHRAAKIAAACRCAQELREFMYDPLSNEVPGSQAQAFVALRDHALNQLLACRDVIDQAHHLACPDQTCIDFPLLQG